MSTPIHSAEAEKYLLSMVFQRDDDLAEAIGLSLESKHFHDPHNAALYEEAVEAFATTGSIIVAQFYSEISKSESRLAAIGGLATFAEVTGGVIMSSNSVKYWVDEIVAVSYTHLRAHET